MIICPSGLQLTPTEHLCLLHCDTDPEQCLLDELAINVGRRKEALIIQWRPVLFADPDVTELPAQDDALVALIIARPEYKTRHQLEVALGDDSTALRGRGSSPIGVVPPGKTYQTARWEHRRVGGPNTVTIFPDGIAIPDADADCLLAYADNIEEWVHGALLGHINRGKKKMIHQYQPILMADPDVAAIPANEDGMIQAITARPDYQTVPEQLQARRESQERLNA